MLLTIKDAKNEVTNKESFYYSLMDGDILTLDSYEFLFDKGLIEDIDDDGFSIFERTDHVGPIEMKFEDFVKWFKMYDIEFFSKTGQHFVDVTSNLMLTNGLDKTLEWK